MKTQTTRNVALGLVGLLALCIYILACTSFSPDDTKILYPVFGNDSAAVGIAVYDRETRRSDLLFLPMAFDGSETNVTNPRLVRAQWLPDGRTIVLAWPAGKGNDDDGLNLATLPLGAATPLKFFYLPEVRQAGMHLMAPLVVAGQRVLLCESNAHLVRLDLKTGTIARHALTGFKDDVTLYPGLDGKGAFYLAQQAGEGPQAYIFGRLNPENFSETPLATITNNLMEGSFFTYSPSGNRVAFVEETAGPRQMVVLQDGKPAFTRPLGTKNEPLSFGSAVLLDNLVVASFQRQTNGQPRATYGLMEIPLSNAPVRETILIADAETHDSADAFYFQMALSHDGKTAAVASTYLACEKEFKPEDCALFLVNLSDPKRPVTRIPVRLPAARSSPSGK